MIESIFVRIEEKLCKFFKNLLYPLSLNYAEGVVWDSSQRYTWPGHSFTFFSVALAMAHYNVSLFLFFQVSATGSRLITKYSVYPQATVMNVICPEVSALKPHYTPVSHFHWYYALDYSLSLWTWSGSRWTCWTPSDVGPLPWVSDCMRHKSYMKQKHEPLEEMGILSFPDFSFGS